MRARSGLRPAVTNITGQAHHHREEQTSEERTSEEQTSEEQTGDEQTSEEQT